MGNILAHMQTSVPGDKLGAAWATLSPHQQAVLQAVLSKQPIPPRPQ